MSIDLREYSGSGFIKLVDVEDGPIRVRIAGIVVGKYNKLDAILKDGSRLSLNATNVKVLRRAYGDTDDDLINKEIELYKGEFDTQQGKKLGVAVRPISPPDDHEAAEAAVDKDQTKPKADYDDTIPF